MTENGNSKTSNNLNDDSSKSGGESTPLSEVLKAFNSIFYYALLLDIILLPLLIIGAKLLYIIKPISGGLLKSVAELQELIVIWGFVVSFLFFISTLFYNWYKKDLKSAWNLSKNILKIVIAFAYLFLFFKIISQIGNSIEHRKYDLDMNYLIFFSYLTSYLVVDFVRNLIVKLKNWIFSDSSNDELVKNKLSFINKIIVGFLSVVATIISIWVSLKD